MNTNQQKSNWILDALLFAGFLVTFALDWTGLPMHQWIGLFGGLLAASHLVLHWKWVSAVTRRFFGKTSVQARGYYLLDAAITTGFSLILMTGLVISTWLSLNLANYAVWANVHATASITTLILIVLKIGLHSRWIVSVARRSIFPPASQPAPVLRTSQTLRQVAASVADSEALPRRDFLRLMGSVGVVSLIAVSFPLLGSEKSQATTTASTEGNESASVIASDVTASTSRSSASSSTTTASSSCTAQCNRHCSFPGRCRRYRDTNGNNLCDFGECV